MSKVRFGIWMILFLAMLAAPVLAQTSGEGEQGARPGPGYGMGPGMMGPGYGHGPGYGMGPGTMGPGPGHGHGCGYGSAWGYGHHMGHMGPGYGYGPGYGWGPGMRGPRARRGEPDLAPEEREARAKAFAEEYIRRYLPGYKLEKKEGVEKK